MKSWKTTLAGAIGALGIYLSTQPGFEIVGQILAGLGSFLTGLFARDNDKTSEDVGAQ
jgi:hypothetical protein